MDIEKLKEFINSEEGKKFNEEYFGRIKRIEDMKFSQIDRFHSKFGDRESFIQFLNKVEHKYSSDEYYNRWIKRGCEPEEALYWFLFDYASIYGRECDDSEWFKYGGDFTGELYYIHGYYFQVMHGQGSVIRIDKADPEFQNYTI